MTVVGRGTWGEITSLVRRVSTSSRGYVQPSSFGRTSWVDRLVTEGIARYRQEADVDQLVRLVCDGRRQARASEANNFANGGQVIDARDRFQESSIPVVNAASQARRSFSHTLITAGVSRCRSRTGHAASTPQKLSCEGTSRTDQR